MWKMVVGWVLIIFMCIAMLYMNFNFHGAAKFSNGEAKNGVLDLTNLPHSTKLLTLSGEWKFIPDRFVDPDIYYADAPNQLVPKALSGNNQYGSYQLFIYLPEHFTDVSFHIRNIWSAHTIYVNGQKLSEVGHVAASKEETVPKNPTYEFNLKPVSNKLLVTIYVSNFYNARGGIIFPIDFGDTDALKGYLEKNMTIEWTAIFLALLFGSFHITICLSRNKETAFFYSGLFFLSLAVFLMTRGDQRLLLRNFPSIPFEFYFRLQDAFTFFALIFLLLFIISIMPAFMKKKQLLYFLSPLILYSLALLIFPARSLSIWQYPCFFYADILLLGIFIRSTFLIWKRTWLIEKNEMIALCVALLMIFVFAFSGSFDQLFFLGNNVINSLSLFGFIISMNVFLALRLINRTVAAENATLQMKHAMTIAQENEMAFLQAQIKPHFLYNALSTIISICYKDGERAAYYLSMLSSYLRYIFQYGNKEHDTFLQEELEVIEAYVQLEKARFGEKYSYSCNIENSIDPNQVTIPRLLIQPLIENAIRHGLFEKEGSGHVQLSISKKGQSLYIEVVDDGVGMSENQCKKIMNGSTTGIGFMNVLRRVRDISNGTLTIDSNEGEGTMIQLTLPLKEI